MQNPHHQKIHVYHQNYGYSPNTQPGSHSIGPNSHHNQFRKSHNQGHNFNEEHWCETCDRSFPSLDLLDKHKQQHQKCNIDGCQFIAHPKVITKHIQMQHSSGLYSKIAKLNNPEEIQKWRDERKRKYPTKVNIEKKAAEIKEKIERGEKMGLKQHGYQKRNQVNKRNVISNGRHYQRGHRKNQSTLMLTQKSTVPKKVHQFLPTANSLQTLKPFSGIQDIIMDDAPEKAVEETMCGFIIEDDDIIKLPESDKNTVELRINEPKVCEALSSLMCNYESSDEETNETKDQTSTNHIKNYKQSTVNKTEINILVLDKLNDSTSKSQNPNTEKNKSDDDSGPEETKIDKIKESDTFEEEPKIVKSIKVKQIPSKNNHNKHNFIKPKHKVPSTLLQKLLKKEIQQERNVVLQCIRHIVRNKYFNGPSDLVNN